MALYRDQSIKQVAEHLRLVLPTPESPPVASTAVVALNVACRCRARRDVGKLNAAR